MCRCVNDDDTKLVLRQQKDSDQRPEKVLRKER
jgi:hypothetical protein